MKRIVGLWLIGLFGWLSAAATTGVRADEPVSFAGKTVTMIVGSPAGGGTDNSARLIALLLANRLPGKPPVIVRNVPGAQGITAMNYFVQQVAPDGLTLMAASTTQADPMLYRKPQSHFNPTAFNFIGGVGRGGTVLLVRKDALPRLHDKSRPPVVMGALGGVPRSGMQMTAFGIEYLGWNAKWVLGYRGTKDLMLALSRGEIDMTTTANLFEIEDYLRSGRFQILAQSGSLHKGQVMARPEFGTAPLFSTLIEGHIHDPIAQKAYDYFAAMTSLDKWLALPPGAPAPLVSTYRDAYEQASNDPEFVELGRKISEDIEPMAYDDVTFLIKRLGQTPPEAMTAISATLRKQGVEAE